MTNEYDLDADADSNFEYKPLDIDLMRKNIPTFSAEKLCSIIVCDRYFGCYREIAVMCMEELASRRLKGDTFAFEKVIDEGYKSLPVLNLGINFNIRDVLQQAIKSQK